MMDLPPGTNAIVETALEEAGQSLFSAAGAPLAQAEELLAAIQGPAVRAVLEKRVEQIVKHGHSREGDLDLPIYWLINDSRIRLQAALDVINTDAPRRNIPVARKRVVTAAAMLLAAIDVLDATINAEGR